MLDELLAELRTIADLLSRRPTRQFPDIRP
jgi:hypothetical protein